MTRHDTASLQEEKKVQKQQQERLLDTLKKRGYSGFNPEQLS